MATVVSSTDSPESIKASFTGKGTVTVSDDAGNDITPKDSDETKIDTQDSAAASTDAENTTDSATVDNDKADADKPSKADKRIDKLTKQISELQEQLKATAPKEPAKEPAKTDNTPSEDAEPKPEDFDTQADFLKALSKWAIKQARKEEKAEAAKNVQVQERQQVLDGWHEQQKAAREKYKDYDEVMSDEVFVGPIAAQTLVELPDGAELAYYIGKHPDEAEALAKLSKERDVAIAIGGLRIKVKGTTSAKAPVTGKDKPKPITPVAGTSTGNVDKPRGEMSYKEYKAKRNQEIAATRRKA